MGNMGRSDQFSQSRRDAFAAEGLRRRAAMRQRGVPGIPAPAGMMNVAPSSLNTMENRMPSHPQFRPGIDAPTGGGGMTTMEHRTPANPGYRPGVDDVGPLQIVPLGGSPGAPAPASPYKYYQPPAETLPAPAPIPQLGQPYTNRGSKFLSNRLDEAQQRLGQQPPQTPEDRMRMNGLLPWHSQLPTREDAARMTTFGSQAPPLSNRQMELGQRADAAAMGQPFGQRMPLEQQGFARSQGFNGMGQGMPGVPMMPSGQAPTPEAFGNARPTNEYGLRRMDNFRPSVSPDAAAGKQDGPIGTVGEATVQRINGRNVVMGPDAKAGYDRYSKAPGETQQSALRSAQNDARDKMLSSDQFKQQVSRLKERNAATQERNSDLRALAQARRSGIKPDSELMGRLAKAKGSTVNLTLQDRASILAPEEQQKIKQVTGFSPANDPPDAILEAAIAGLDSLDPGDVEGRQAILQGVKAAKGRKDFGKSIMGFNYSQHQKELDKLLANPDQYLKSKRTKVQSPNPLVQNYDKPDWFGRPNKKQAPQL